MARSVGHPLDMDAAQTRFSLLQILPAGCPGVPGRVIRAPQGCYRRARAEQWAQRCAQAPHAIWLPSPWCRSLPLVLFGC